MMSCREVAWLVSSGTVDESPLHVRLGVRLHAAMCRHCRAAQRAWTRIAATAREAHRRSGDEPEPDFEQRLLRELSRVPGSGDGTQGGER
jgi:hypothetical protein